MKRIEQRNIQDIINEYPSVYSSVFGEWTSESNCPTTVYLGYEDDNLVGFLAGYALSPTDWYLQRAGFGRQFRGRYQNLANAKFALNEIHNSWPCIMTLIRNDDWGVLRMCLELRFVIIGTRLDSSKQLWVEMMHLKKEE